MVSAAFRTATGRDPAGVAFAPGRVNLIGEHIDYHGGPVLPAALQRGISVAFAHRDDARVRARTVTPAGAVVHAPIDLAVDPVVDPAPTGGWGDYVQAAVLATAPRSGSARTGADLVVMSDLPEASGLSSSSALVVGVGLALLAAEGRLGQLSAERRGVLAGRFAAAERFTGTEGGGMDQAASLGGVADHALHITFDPLRWRPVALPPEAAFVVAHSGVRAEKSGAAQEAYNRIRAATEDPDVAAHIRTERQRVDDFVAVLGSFAARSRAGEGRGAEGVGEMLQRLGALMSASHASLRDRLDVSHPALETLVAAAGEGGAAGARLTGAGFGGSIVALAPRAAAFDLVQALRRAQARLEGSPEPAFVVRAGDGARIVDAV